VGGSGILRASMIESNLPRALKTVRSTGFGVALLSCLGAGCSDDRQVAQPPDSAPVHSAVNVAARDGTRLAVDVHLPKGSKSGTPLPTILRITRYWRAIELANGKTAPDRYADAIAAHGYAYVMLDVRGSGASFGVSTSPWSHEEVLDYRDVLDWITQQPWSNGRVGALGVSYEGNTAALLSALEHPAVRAVVPLFFDFDPYRSPALPGGLFDEDFIHSWSQLTDAIDEGDICTALGATSASECALLRSQIRGPLRVDADRDGALLAEAMAEHRSNTRVYAAVSAITYRDDPYGAQGASLSDISPFAFAGAIDRGGVPWLSWGSWYDSGTADASLNAFATFHNPQSVVIGAYSHGAEHDADPYRDSIAAVAPAPAEQIEQALRFLDDHLQRDAAPSERSIRYYTVGEGQWRTTASWPPPGVERQDWFLVGDNRLATAPPEVAESDHYSVDFTATTGRVNRWATQKDGADVVYADRAQQAAKLLSYTSDPLPEALRVVGHPIVNVYLSSTRDDGALFVYLEDVAPGGRVTYVTEGQLRLLHRRTSDSPYVTFGPQHSFLRADGAALVPGQSELVELTLLPVAVLIRAGHCLRVSIAGHDADTFRRYPEEGPVELTLEHSPSQASRVSLPFLR